MAPGSEQHGKELYIEKFKGDNFLSWKVRLKSKMGILKDEYNVLFAYFEQSKLDRPISDDDFKKSDGNDDQDKLKMSKVLKSLYIVSLRLLYRRGLTVRLYSASGLSFGVV